MAFITVLLTDYQSTGSGDAPLSYFSLGSALASTDEPTAALRGDELLSGIRFKDDLRATVPTGQDYFESDGSDLSATDSTGRDGLSAALLTRGGWREHTDGNRISTTRGDVVEVVYGNYKLVVLGRVRNDFDPTLRGGLGGPTGDANSTLSQCVFDASGGLISGETSTGGTIVSSTWDDGSEDGSWKSIEQTDAGDKRVIYRGSYESVFFGPSIYLSVGHGAEAVSIDSGKNTAGGHAAERPAVTTSTFARTISQNARYQVESESISAKNVTDHLEVEHSSVTAEVWKKKGSMVATCAFREELAAKNIHQEVAFGKTRFVGQIGAVRVETHAIGYHQILKQKSRTDLWIKGLHGNFQAPLAASLKVGMDSAYRIAPSVDFVEGSSLRLHATVDALLPISRLVTWLFVKRAYVLDGDVVVIKVQNSAASTTV